MITKFAAAAACICLLATIPVNIYAVMCDDYSVGSINSTLIIAGLLFSLPVLLGLLTDEH